ncbi:MAG: hypothetical protein HYV27_18045 [Candidatus Hydrogenedentes bacterium]|nr:hypothetical protein [Candidatus Hydrogenedentota bacterium]
MRELRNVVERAAQHCRNAIIDECDLELPVLPAFADKTGNAIAQRTKLEGLLAAHKGDVALAASALGIARSTLYYRMRKLGMVTPKRHHAD